MAEDKKFPEGLKWTKQRKDVYEILQAATEPLSAAQIYGLILKKGVEQSYAMSTVYRILAAFEEKMLIDKSNFMGDDTILYELKKDEHTHYAVCLSCHKKVPVHICPLEHLNLNQGVQGNHSLHDLGAADDFTITAHKLELYGYCKECEKALG